MGLQKGNCAEYSFWCSVAMPYGFDVAVIVVAVQALTQWNG